MTSMPGREIHTTYFVCGDGGYEIIQVHVGSVETCCIRGRVFRQQFLIRDNYSGFTDMAIEGIGVSGPGRFFAPYPGDRFAGGYLHPHSELRLREVSDTDGNVIFSQKKSASETLNRCSLKAGDGNIGIRECSVIIIT